MFGRRHRRSHQTPQEIFDRKFNELFATPSTVTSTLLLEFLSNPDNANGAPACPNPRDTLLEYLKSAVDKYGKTFAQVFRNLVHDDQSRADHCNGTKPKKAGRRRKYFY
jgi:hypothetical protein